MYNVFMLHRISLLTSQSALTQKTSATQSSQPTGTDSTPSDSKSLAANDIAVDSQSQVSDGSDFLGGRRMNALLKALNHEQECGLFFRKYITRTNNKVGCCRITVIR